MTRREKQLERELVIARQNLDDRARTIEDLEGKLEFQLATKPAADGPPIPLLLWCPECGNRHVDRHTFSTKPHHTHACQECGHCWRPAVVATVGVQFLPGFKDPDA